MARSEEFDQGTGKQEHKLEFTKHSYGLGASCSCGNFSEWHNFVRQRGDKGNTRAYIKAKFKAHKEGQ